MSRGTAIPRRRPAERVRRNTRTECWIRPRPSRRATDGPTAPAAPEPGRFVEWHDMSPGERTVAWARLRAWVSWLTDRYELTVENRMPICWARHPGLVEELWSLMTWRLEVYGGSQPQPGQASRYWHAELKQVLHAATTVYAPGCRAGHRGATVVVADDPELQDAWAEANVTAGTPEAETAAGLARRSGNLASPDYMAAAIDQGTAVQVTGLRDYLYCDGAWWASASAGWIQVPAPAVVPEQGDDVGLDWAGRGFRKEND